MWEAAVVHVGANLLLIAWILKLHELFPGSHRLFQRWSAFMPAHLAFIALHPWILQSFGEIIRYVIVGHTFIVGVTYWGLAAGCDPTDDSGLSASAKDLQGGVSMERVLWVFCKVGFVTQWRIPSKPSGMRQAALMPLLVDIIGLLFVAWIALQCYSSAASLLLQKTSTLSVMSDTSDVLHIRPMSTAMQLGEVWLQQREGTAMNGTSFLDEVAEAFPHPPCTWYNVCPSSLFGIRLEGETMWRILGGQLYWFAFVPSALFLLYFSLSTLERFLGLVGVLCGAEAADPFRFPLAAPSLTKLWSSYWHIPVSRALRRGVAVPLLQLIPQAPRLFGGAAAFAVSGLFHEWMAAQSFGEFNGTQLAFFLLQAVLVSGELLVLRRWASLRDRSMFTVASFAAGLLTVPLFVHSFLRRDMVLKQAMGVWSLVCWFDHRAGEPP